MPQNICKQIFIFLWDLCCHTFLKDMVRTNFIPIKFTFKKSLNLERSFHWFHNFNCSKMRSRNLMSITFLEGFGLRDTTRGTWVGSDKFKNFITYLKDLFKKKISSDDVSIERKITSQIQKTTSGDELEQPPLKRMKFLNLSDPT